VAARGDSAAASSRASDVGGDTPRSVGGAARLGARGMVGECWVMLLSHPLDDLGWDGLEGHAGRADAEFMRRYATCRFG